MSLRREVLQSFKSLHRARKLIFKGDDFALKMGRTRINEEFKKNKHVSDNQAIAELVKYCNDVEHELRTCVIQAVAKTPGKYQAIITPDTVRLDNVPYKDCGGQKNKT